MLTVFGSTALDTIRTPKKTLKNVLVGAATFAAISFFGWKRVSKGVHLTASWLLAIGSNLSALWILIANGFMQHPSSAFYTFNIDTARLELTDFFALILLY